MVDEAPCTSEALGAGYRVTVAGKGQGVNPWTGQRRSEDVRMRLLVFVHGGKTIQVLGRVIASDDPRETEASLGVFDEVARSVRLLAEGGK